MSKILNRKFFKKDTLLVARSLLGKVLCRKIGKKIIRAIITEVEAYDGPKDKASHAARGETPRNALMFGEAGRFYVYFTYGMHWILNIVTGKRGYPAAVLIRGVKLINSKSEILNLKQNKLRLNGPAKLTKFLKIDKKLNGKLASRKTGLWIEDLGLVIRKSQIAKSSRISVHYAGPVWSKKHYRFFIEQ